MCVCAMAGQGSRYTSWKKWPLQKHRTWVHPALHKQASGVPGAGVGVFTTHDLKKGVHLGYYTGRLHWTYPDEDARDHQYLMEIPRRPAWIARAEWHANRTTTPPLVNGEGLLGYLNCAKGQSTLQNCAFSKSGRFETIRDIPQGSELFIDYGDYYWE